MLKGTNPDFDSYSLFFDNGDNGALGSTGLDISLTSKGIRTGKKMEAKLLLNFSVFLAICVNKPTCLFSVVLTGIATDYVVGRTALDALSFGLTTFVIDELIRGITDDGIDLWRNKIINNGGIIVNTAQQMVEDSERWDGIRAAYPPISTSCEHVKDIC